MTDKVAQVSAYYSRLFDSYLNTLNIDNDTIDKFNLRSSKLKSGAVASGSKLLADGTSLETINTKIPIDKGIIAFEMEGSGFAPACIDQSFRWLVFRGISDYGGADKNNISPCEQIVSSKMILSLRKLGLHNEIEMFNQMNKISSFYMLI